MEALGPKIRRQRRQLGLTLDELSGRTDISKPYLSLIETGRVTNPPSDEKLSRLERSLGFATGELLTQAHLQRTPQDVRAVLAKLMGDRGFGANASGGAAVLPSLGSATPASSSETAALASDAVAESATAAADRALGKSAGPSASRAIDALTGKAAGRGKSASPAASAIASPEKESPVPLSLDAAYLSGVLQELVDQSAGNVERIRTNAVPLINRVAAGYPSDFTDLSYPARVADSYIGCPDIDDPDAFATRVHGDSMTPKYRDGDIVIFSPARNPRSGDDCFVRFEDGRTTFKRAFFESEDNGQAVIRLQPRNEKYKPQMVPSEQISGLYKAVYRFQNLDEE